jgi:hypothetical protein
LLRGIGAPFEITGDRVRNQIRIKLENRTPREASYQIQLANAPDAELVTAENPLHVAAGGRATTSVFISLPRAAFANGSREVELLFRDADGVTYEKTCQLLGPRGVGS